MTHQILMLLGNNAFPNDPRVRNEATTLVDAGYEVTVICPTKGDLSSYELYNGIHVHRFPAPPEGHGILGYMWEFGYSTLAILITSISVFFKRGFDAVHLHNPPDVLVIVALFYKLLGKRVVFDHHDLAPEMYQVLFDNPKKILHRLLLLFENLSCRIADHVIVTNESYRQIDMERNGVSPQNITIVRNGPNAKFQPLEPDLSLVHPGKMTLCYVGEMGHHDGLDYLVRALAHLKNDLNRTDFYCLMIGDGSARKKVRLLATELGLDDHVNFTGYVRFTDVTRYLSSSDICVAPEPSNEYNNRSTVIKMMEYMAIGKPVVSFDLPEHRFSAQDASLYAEANNELDYARKIEYLMDTPAVRNEMSKAGLARIEAELSWPCQAEKLLSAYDSIFPSKSRAVQTEEPVKVS